MPELRAHLETARTIAQITETVRAELNMDRVSIARFDHLLETFEIVVSAGKPLLSPGLQVPLDFSTQLLTPAGGRTFMAPSFADDPMWDRPVDQLMLGLGFAAGCSIALGPRSRPVGAISLSSVSRHRAFDVRLDALATVSDLLASRLLVAEQHPTVLVCHDQPIVAEGLMRVLERELGVETRLGCSPEGAVKLARTIPLASIVCGTYLAGRSAGALCAELRRAGTAAPLVILSHRDTPHDRTAAIASGAAAYAVLGEDYSGIVDAVASVCAGRTALPPAERPVRDAVDVRLTRREGDVLLDLDDGLRFKEIATRRGISTTTAKSYARSLFRKMGAHSRTEAVNEARARGLLESLRLARRDEQG